jgi:REP-associated tyrosine transposase
VSRQLRIEYPGAFYHVTSRGNEKRTVFRTDGDFHYFIKCLRDAFDRFGSIIHVYCLMNNHYHLLIETPMGNLSSIMHLVNTSYTVYFNKTHERFGHLFQGRFKAILVQAEAYAQELGPYIHLNPVRAKLVNSAEQWPWSNYRAYRGDQDPEPWTSTSLILSLFSARPAEARRRYVEAVARRMTDRSWSPLKAAIPSGVLGDPQFVERIRQKYLTQNGQEEDRELPQLRKLKLKPQMQEVLELTSRFFGPKNRYARNAAIFVIHKNMDYRLREIAGFFELSVSGITEADRRFRKMMTSNETLSRLVRGIEGEMLKKAATKVRTDPGD